MLERAWAALARPSERVRKFYVGLSSAAFSIAWLTVGLMAARHWRTMPNDSHLWVISLLYFSLLVWVGLLRGGTMPSSTIACLAFMLGAAAQLWFSYLH